MKKTIAIIFTLALLLGVFTGCQSADDKALNAATPNFNAAASELQTLKSTLNSKISEAESLLSSTNAEDVLGPTVLDKLQFALDTAKALTVDIPAIADTADAVNQQISDISTLKSEVQSQCDSLDNACTAIATSKQALADKVEADKKAEEDRIAEELANTIEPLVFNEDDLEHICGFENISNGYISTPNAGNFDGRWDFSGRLYYMVDDMSVSFNARNAVADKVSQPIFVDETNNAIKIAYGNRSAAIQYDLSNNVLTRTIIIKPQGKTTTTLIQYKSKIDSNDWDTMLNSCKQFQTKVNEYITSKGKNAYGDALESCGLTTGSQGYWIKLYWDGSLASDDYYFYKTGEKDNKNITNIFEMTVIGFKDGQAYGMQDFVDFSSGDAWAANGKESFVNLGSKDIRNILANLSIGLIAPTYSPNPSTYPKTGAEFYKILNENTWR